MSQKRALVTDDMEINRLTIKTFLSVLGFQVDVAVDGADGIKKLNENKYDVVFSDIEMPNMNGYEFLQRIRRDPNHKNIPVIMLSTLKKPEDIDKAKKLGANHYLVKPFTGDGMKAAIKAVGL